MKRKDKMAVFGMGLYGAVIFAVFLAWGLHSRTAEFPELEAPAVTVSGLARQREVIQAEPLVYVSPEMTQASEYLDECVEAPEVYVIEDCTVTYYCAERYPHICGTGDGITATGDAVMPGVTCAVDPSVIPYGSIVSVDYGDGVLHEYVAQDAGAWIDGSHIDICVKSHTEALELGRKTATVYWRAPEVAA